VAAEHWMAEPEAQDCPAAKSYLSLLVGPTEAAKLVKAPRRQKTLNRYAAKDILRASGLPLLPSDGSAAGLVDVAFARRGRAGRMSSCRRSSLRSSSGTWSRSLVGLI
jgi:hypothetical protein